MELKMEMLRLNKLVCNLAQWFLNSYVSHAKHNPVKCTQVPVQGNVPIMLSWIGFKQDVNSINITNAVIFSYN